MGVYIKGMEMPKSCYKCDMRRRDGMDIVCPIAHERFSIADVNILEYRLDNCPLVPVPPHGRLGDLDELAKRVKDEGRNQAEYYADRYHPVVMAYGDCYGKVSFAPTIIPADPEEEATNV